MTCSERPGNKGGDRLVVNRVIIGKDFNDAILVSNAISGKFIRVQSVALNAIVATSGTIQVGIQNSGASGSETVIYEHFITWNSVTAVSSGVSPLQVPSKDIGCGAVAVIPVLQNGQGLRVRTNASANSGMYSATVNFWVDED